MGKLKVGAGKALINLPEHLFPYHRFDTGYLEAKGDGDLYVRAIAIDNEEKRFLFIAIDGCSSPDQEFKKRLAEKYGLEKDYIFTANTHNHSSPQWGAVTAGAIDTVTEDRTKKRMEYAKTVTAGIWQASDEAFGSLRPARYGFGEGKSYININRDEQFEDGSWMQGQNFTGPSDKTMAVLKFEDLDGNLIGAVLNYACHGTLAFLCKDSDGKVKVTPEFMGYACEYAEQRFGGGAVIMWTCGAEGDQNPLFSSEGFPRTFEADGYSERVMTPPGTQYILQKHFGCIHGIDAIKTLKRINCKHDHMKLFAVSKTIELVGQHAPEGADMMLNRLFVDNLVRESRPDLCIDGKAPEKKLVTMVPGGTVPLLMQLAIFGEVAWVGIAGEPYCSIALKCKEQSPFKNTVIMTHIDAQSAHYILSDDAADHRVFQSFCRVYPGNNDEAIVNGMLNMFDEILNT